MPTLYLIEQYSTVKIDGEALRIQGPAEKGTRRPGEIRRIPINHIDQVIVFGDITLTTPALHALLQRRIGIHYLSAYGRSYGSLTADWGKNSNVRLAQYAFYQNHQQRFALAQRYLAAKIRNMRTLTQRHARSRDQHSQLEQIANDLRKQQQKLLQQQASDDQPSDRMHGLGSLFGIEGESSATYYQSFAHILDPQQWPFPGRVKRPPTDPINALLSFGYTVLTNLFVSSIHSVGLDPAIGFLHQPGFGKPALALDLIEPYRAIIVDSTVITLLNTKQIQTSDFAEEYGAYRLHDQAKRLFLNKLEARLDETIQHPTFQYRCTYRRSLELEARLFSQYIQGDIEHYQPFTVR
jgi:CRISPR-associated protein Cas1